MSSVDTAKTILEELAKQVSQLSETDIQKIGKGTHELSVKLVKKKTEQPESTELLAPQKEMLLSRLHSCTSREKGHAVISEALKNKKELEQFAKHLDVSVLKQDKVEQIKNKIIEATVGAILRSNAIQGKT